MMAVKSSNTTASATMYRAHARSKKEAQRHHQGIAERVHDAVSHIARGKRLLAIMPDDGWAVLGDLPRDLDAHGNQESHADRNARCGQVQHAEKDEAVDEVRKAVPVGELLRHLRAERVVRPQQDVPAGGEEGLAETMQRGDLYR
jgi:hypothetical protein